MTATFVRHPEVESKVLPDGCLVLFNPRTRWAQTLSPLGAIVWEHCDGTNSVDEIMEVFRGLDGIDCDKEFEEQVSSLVLELEESGLVEPSGDQDFSP